MIREVQKVYRLQGVEINDKHVEVIVRQMLKKIRIENSGDTGVSSGYPLWMSLTLRKSMKIWLTGYAAGRGYTGYAGNHESFPGNQFFLSAASFQETTKVLTEAAIKGKVDPLIGLKRKMSSLVN